MYYNNLYISKNKNNKAPLLINSRIFNKCKKVKKNFKFIIYFIFLFFSIYFITTYIKIKPKNIDNCNKAINNIKKKLEDLNNLINKSSF